jgi:lipopolysaccharide/colanic/teichoic acid biosynthesis glycosyltransferase
MAASTESGLVNVVTAATEASASSADLARSTRLVGAIAVWNPHRPRWAELMKRAIDVAGAAIGVVVGAPALLLIALAIWFIDGWPVLYRWEVLGKDGRPFTGFKFRTMVPNADELRRDLLARNEMQGPVFKLRHDPRVTRLGAFLRRASLDELPQLWSVLKGDMSLVGPRPLYADEYELATQEQRRKLSVKPGITCLWQVCGRSETADFAEWVRLDLEYIDRWSLGLDLKIMLRTLPAVLSRRGAW